MTDSDRADDSAPADSPRGDAIAIWQAGVDAVRAEPLVRRVTRTDGDRLLIEDHSWDRREYDRILVVGGGKAAAAMARGFAAAVGQWLPIQGWVNVPGGTEGDSAGTGREIAGIHVHPARPPGVNEPTPEAVQGTERILELFENATPRDLCVTLLSGGGSALLPAPAPGISLDDKLVVTRRLSESGADITELNTVRKWLSAIKGGRLWERCRGRSLITLVLSDVLGDPLELIASGPTVADTSTPDDALAVLRKYDPDRTLPEAVYGRLRSARAGNLGKQETARRVPVIHLVIGNNAVAVDAAGSCAERLGYNHAMHSARRCEGPAEEVGRQLASMAIEMLGTGRSASRPSHRTNCLITGGEPTVMLAPPERRGRGGRNQQLVLAAYLALHDAGLSDSQWSRLALVSGGTDGEDGPTDAAGAVIDADLHRRVTALGLDPADALNRNDAYTFFRAAGGLLRTGPTGTNVCDVRVLVIRPRATP